MYGVIMKGSDKGISVYFQGHTRIFGGKFPKVIRLHH